MMNWMMKQSVKTSDLLIFIWNLICCHFVVLQCKTCIIVNSQNGNSNSDDYTTTDKHHIYEKVHNSRLN